MHEGENLLAHAGRGSSGRQSERVTDLHTSRPPPAGSINRNPGAQINQAWAT